MSLSRSVVPFALVRFNFFIGAISRIVEIFLHDRTSVSFFETLIVTGLELSRDKCLLIVVFYKNIFSNKSVDKLFKYCEMVNPKYLLYFS